MSACCNVPTIKPLDSETIRSEAGKSGRLIVVAENHTVIGGLGEAVAGLLMRSGISSDLPSDRTSRRISGCRSASDLARQIRHFSRRSDSADQGMVVMKRHHGVFERDGFSDSCETEFSQFTMGFVYLSSIPS